MSSAKQLTIDEALSKAKKAVRNRQHALAAELYRAILARQPSHPIAKKALRKLDRGLQRRSPANPGAAEPGPHAVNQLLELLNLGHMQQVERSASELLRDFPRSIVVMNLLGIALQRQHKLSDALQVLDEAISLNPGVPESHANRGIVLREMGRADEALASYDRAIELHADFPEAHYNRGNALLGLGRFDDAATCFERAIALRETFAAAHRSLAALKRYQPGDAQLAQMTGLYAAGSASDADRMELGFALGKAFDDLGDVDAAFAHLAEGNRLRKKMQGYDIRHDSELFSNIRRLFADAAAPTTEAAQAPLRSVFIVGMLRSGTSLVEQILASHSRVHGAGELEAMTGLAAPLLASLLEAADSGDLKGVPAAESGRLRTAYLGALQELGVPETVITDKMPLNFRWIGFILAAFPGAKIVHVKRDPMATCWSIYRHYFPDPSLFAYDLGDIAEYYLLYEGLMAFWRQRFAASILDLDYERLSERQEEETRRLLDFCELEWEERCLAFHETERQVRTISAAQVRQQMYQGSSAAWRRYERHLQPMAAALGYDLS